MVTIHQLKVFVSIAESRSIRRAAEQLVVTQPAVSSILASLEKEIGVELVARSGRGIALTEAGEVLHGYARSLLGLLDEAITATRGVVDPAGSEVRIGATTASADHMLMPLLARARDKRPEMRFSLEVGNRARIWQLLADRHIDLAISSQPPVSGAFDSLATHPNEFVLVAKPGLVWPGRVGDATWLVREQGSSTRAATDEAMAMLGVAPTVLVIGSNSAIQSSAEAGLGVALLPRDAVKEAIRSRHLATVKVPASPLSKPWHLLIRAGENLNAVTRQFVSDLIGCDGGFELTPVGASMNLAAGS
jgi:DNA-binding transcriptional LysR family regulator